MDGWVTGFDDNCNVCDARRFFTHATFQPLAVAMLLLAVAAPGAPVVVTVCDPAVTVAKLPNNVLIADACNAVCAIENETFIPVTNIDCNDEHPSKALFNKVAVIPLKLYAGTTVILLQLLNAPIALTIGVLPNVGNVNKFVQLVNTFDIVLTLFALVKFTLVIEEHPKNIDEMSVTFEMLNDGNDCTDTQLRNIATVLVTLDRLNDGTFTRDEQSSNMYDVSIADDVSNSGTSVSLLHPSNIEPKYFTLDVSNSGTRFNDAHAGEL